VVEENLPPVKGPGSAGSTPIGAPATVLPAGGPLPGAKGPRLVKVAEAGAGIELTGLFVTDDPDGVTKGKPPSQKFPSAIRRLAFVAVFRSRPPDGTDVSVEAADKAGPLPAGGGPSFTAENNATGEFQVELPVRPRGDSFADGAYQAKARINGKVVALLNWEVGGPRAANPPSPQQTSAGPPPPAKVGPPPPPARKESPPPPRPQAAGKVPALSDLRITATTYRPPSIKFTVRIALGKEPIDEMWACVGVPGGEKVLEVLAGRFRKGLLAINGISLGNPPPDFKAQRCWLRRKAGTNEYAGEVRFLGVTLPGPVTPVAFLLADEAGRRSNPVVLEVNLETGKVTRPGR
jgi:hypothetical protein